MNKRKLHHKLVRVRSLPTYLLLALAVFFGITAVFSLRSNNQKMIELRDAVYAADEQDGDVEAALKELREHVYAHMNTDLAPGDNAIRPPIQLKYTYERLVQAEQAKLQAANAKAYKNATTHCESRYGPGQIIPRAQCVTEYLSSHGVKSVSVSEDLYKFDFVSPDWSPDLAGWSLVLAALFGVLFILRVAAEWFLRLETS